MMKTRKLFYLVLILVLAALAIVACGDSDDSGESNTSTVTTFRTVDVEAAYEGLQQNSDAIIVDVRNANEWADTGVPVGATLISLPVFDQQAPSELSRDGEIYVICNSGNRSRVASQSLIDMGYTNVVNVEGGIQAWLRAGLPVEAYTP